MNWGDVKPWIAKLAPMLGTALGGPLGLAAGTLVANALGIKDASPESIKEALSNGTLTGDQIVALKKAEEDFQLQMAQINITSVKDLEALAVDDRKSAREREEKVGDKTPAIGFYFITLGFFGLLVAMLFHVIPEANKAVLYTMVGSLGAAWLGCVNYYYGTTKGSQDKNDLLYNSAPVDKNS